MTVGFIGSGMIGGTVARLSVAAGHRVVLSNSRGPDTLKELVGELGSLASAADCAGAAAAGDLVLVSIPFGTSLGLPAEPLAGKIVMDTGNYYPERDGQFAALDSESATSSGLLQRHLNEAHVVKVFNNIYFRHLASLARPHGAIDHGAIDHGAIDHGAIDHGAIDHGAIDHGAADRSALPIAGDDEQAKTAVTEFLDSIGYDTVDAGSLADSWRQEPGHPAYGPPYGSFADPAGTPASAAKIRAALAAAQR
jgi:hypothetical protein